MADLRELLKEDEDIALLAISIDDAEKSRGLIEKIAKDGKGEINFPLLSDPNHKTIDAYGLLDKRYMGKDVEGIPQTAIYILDKNRKILWANVEENYRKRPTVEEIRTQIDKF